VPDIYQGAEIWDLSLVDPDNRRPVDYAHRQRLLADVRDAAPAAVLARMDEGAPKIWLIARLLEQRRRRPKLFESSGYVPLAAVGSKARHVVSFVRDDLLVIVPRLLIGLGTDWGDTNIELPVGLWIDLLTGGQQPGGAPVALDQILQAFPVAVLARERV
jgi:(1->4)-alpha-D-glucan 1-alpha-D-glucosylmutase